MLDAKSLGVASAACRSLKEVCLGRYPWKVLCSREWGLVEEAEKEEEGACGKVGRKGGWGGGGLSSHDRLRSFLPCALAAGAER